MNKRILLLAAAGLILLGFLMSCTLSGMSDVEFAKELMRESADATGLYPEPVSGKSGSSGAAGLTFTISLPDGNPPETGPYIVTVGFDDYTPTFAPNSLVNGELTLEVTLDLDNEMVTILFYGELVVVGEHGGTYEYDARLIIDLSTGEYKYAEDIMIDGDVHKTG